MPGWLIDNSQSNQQMDILSCLELLVIDEYFTHLWYFKILVVMTDFKLSLLVTNMQITCEISYFVGWWTVRQRLGFDIGIQKPSMHSFMDLCLEWNCFRLVLSSQLDFFNEAVGPFLFLTNYCAILPWKSYLLNLIQFRWDQMFTFQKLPLLLLIISLELAKLLCCSSCFIYLSSHLTQAWFLHFLVYIKLII